MKTIMYIAILALMVGCEKEELNDCKTCQVKVHYVSQGMAQDYIESSTEYCNEAEWRAIDGQRKIATGANQGISYKKTWTTTCK